MSHIIVSQILLKSIHAYCIHVDLNLNIRATNDNSSNSDYRTFETGCCLLDYFDEKSREKLSLAFKSLLNENEGILNENEGIKVLTTPVEMGKSISKIRWSICLTKNEQNEISGYDLLGVKIIPTAKENTLAASHDTAIDEKGPNKDEKRLRLILAQLKKILHSSVDLICTTDETGRFTYLSAACKEILGYKPKELLGKNYIDYVHPEDVEASKAISKEILSGIGTTNFQNRFYKKDGSLAFLTWSSRWEEADKRFYSIARDSTEKKNERELFETFRRKVPCSFLQSLSTKLDI